MQYHIQTLVKHLFDKDSFEQVSVQELKQFTDDYPYAAVGQFLYAKKLKDAGSYNHYEQGEQASLYFSNALWLRWILNQKDEAPALPVRTEEPAQQPGFRIVVQMPKAAAPPKPPMVREEEKIEPAPEPVTVAAEAIPAEAPAAAAGNGVHKEEEAVAEVVAAAGTIENKTVAEEQPAQAVEQPVETAVAAEPENTVVAQNEQTSTGEAAEPAATEAASAVAIAENSQLAEESTVEAAVNAVSITEEVLTLPAGGDANTVVTASEETVPVASATETSTAENVIQHEQTASVQEPEPVQTVAVDETAEAVAPQPVETAPAEEVTAAPAEDIQDQPVVEEPVAQAEQAPAPVEAESTTEAPVEEKAPQPEPVAAEAAPVVFTQASQEAKTSVDLGEPIFESYHTIDYFASQGIKLGQEEYTNNKLGKQLKSFTDWLRSMKRIGPIETNTSLDEVTNKSIQRIAEHSVEEKEILTEAMAEVWAKQGHIARAIRIYEKLSLHNPAKSPYFAGRIEQLKAL